MTIVARFENKRSFWFFFNEHSKLVKVGGEIPSPRKKIIFVRKFFHHDTKVLIEIIFSADLFDSWYVIYFLVVFYSEEVVLVNWIICPKEV